MHKIILKI